MCEILGCGLCPTYHDFCPKVSLVSYRGFIPENLIFFYVFIHRLLTLSLL